MSVQTESRRALQELIVLLQEVDQRWAGPEWNLHGPEDVAAAHRSLMHVLEGGLTGMFESDPLHPQFRRIVTPWRKFTGDNSDAIYFDAPVNGEHAYVVRGTMAGAVYVSLTVEVGTEGGAMASRTAGVINDTQFDVDEQGWFTIRFGGEPAERNWLPLPAEASRITTRHYFEEAVCAAGDPRHEPVLLIEMLDPVPPPVMDDQAVAAGIRRVAGFVHSRTLGMPPMANAQQPAFVSLTPNQFPPPVLPGDFGLSAFDAAYSMAPYFLGPDEALVITGRWPQKCRFANVCLWTRHQQTFDYMNRQVSLNRTQTQLEPDGSFRMIIAHQDPGHPNWIDTEGRALGLVFWRFFLPEEEIETPQAKVVKFEELAG